MTAVQQTYRLFARREARGRSAAYESLAESVADDAALAGFIASLPPAKRQPNLLFAAAYFLLGVPPGIGQLRELVSQRPAELVQLILTRRTQTNEPARCALLLPALAQLQQPLALIEAGASAGLTLLFDRYSYDYAGYRLAGSDPYAPTPAWSGRGRATEGSGSRRRSHQPAVTRPRYIAVTCLQTCPYWQRRRHETPPWSSTTPLSCATSSRTSENRSPAQFAAWAPSGCLTKHPASWPERPGQPSTGTCAYSPVMATPSRIPTATEHGCNGCADHDPGPSAVFIASPCASRLLCIRGADPDLVPGATPGRSGDERTSP